jgi:hypothetical protein
LFTLGYIDPVVDETGLTARQIAEILGGRAPSMTQEAKDGLYGATCVAGSHAGKTTIDSAEMQPSKPGTARGVISATLGT